MDFKRVLRELRTEKGLAAKDLASHFNFSVSIVYEWEHGRCEPSFDVLCRLATFFNVTVDYLLGLEDDFGNVNVVASGEVVELTEDEKTLLSCFGALGPFEREAILIQIKALAGKNSQHRTKV